MLARGVCRSVLWVALLLLAPARAHAQDRSSSTKERRFELKYEQTIPGCPAYEDALAAIIRRAKGAAAGGAGSMVFEFGVSRSGRDGRLVIRGPRGRRREREVHAGSCSELVDAMALIATVALERTKSSPPAGQLAPTSSVAAYPQPPSTDAQLTDTSAEQLPTKAEVPSAAPPAAAAVDPTPKDPPGQIGAGPAPVPPGNGSRRFGVGVGVRWNSAVAPDPIVAESVFAEVRAGRSHGVQPSGRLELLHGTSAVASTAEGDAQFEWSAGRLFACATSGIPVALLRLGLCGVGELGQLKVNVYRTATRSRPTRIVWGALGATLRTAFVLDPLMLEAEGGLLAPLLRDSFYFAPRTLDTEVHQVPAVGWTAGLALGAQF